MCSDTSNQLATEMAASGDDDQYQYISYDQTLRPPGLDFLTSLSSIAPGEGQSDFLDALTVAADSLFRTLEDRPELQKAGVTKRIILLSDFATPAKDDPEDEFIPALMGKLAEKDVLLEVNCLDATQQVRFIPSTWLAYWTSGRVQGPCHIFKEIELVQPTCMAASKVIYFHCDHACPESMASTTSLMLTLPQKLCASSGMRIHTRFLGQSGLNGTATCMLRRFLLKLIERMISSELLQALFNSYDCMRY